MAHKFGFNLATFTNTELKTGVVVAENHSQQIFQAHVRVFCSILRETERYFQELVRKYI